MNTISQISNLEKHRLHSLQTSIRLRRFSLNITHWELLLLIYELDGDPEYGINDYIDNLNTMRSTRLTIQNFIKDRIQEGDLLIAPSLKKSKKTLTLAPELKSELEAYVVSSWKYSSELVVV